MKRRRRVELPVGCWTVMLLPLVLVTAPFVLTFTAIQERRQRCPNCGRRGTLERVRLESSGSLDLPAREDWQDMRWENLRRVSPDSVVWQCRVCGARFKQDNLLTEISS